MSLTHETNKRQRIYGKKFKERTVRRSAST